jgi:transposase-like protein
MRRGRRQFTDEFKRESVALLASSGRRLLQIASELGIRYGTIHTPMIG